MIAAGGLAAVLAALWTGCAAPAPAAPGLWLELNVPAFRLDACADTALVRSFPVAVGTRKYPTPLGDFRITEVVWNPWWRPPESDWARGRTVTPPGPDNPAGRVKLTFRRLYHLHGTPEEESLGRAASHGCVRLANRDVIELARLVHGAASPEVPRARLDRLEAEPWHTASVPLAAPVPLRIVYRVAEVREGRLELYPDVYRRAASQRTEALRALRERGIAEEALDGARLDRLLRDARRGAASAPLEELVRAGATVSDSSALPAYSRPAQAIGADAVARPCP